MSNPWQWDPNRRKYYLPRNGQYHYQDGTVVDSNGGTISEPASSSATSIPQRQSLQHDSPPGQYQIDALSQTFNKVNFGQEAGGASHTKFTAPVHPDAQAEQGTRGTRTRAPSFQGREVPAVLDSFTIRGTKGDSESLNPHYKVRRDFFRTGRVFKVLWPELRGNPNRKAPSEISQNTTLHISRATYGQEVHAKIAWFVVYLEAGDSSWCLRIQTYNGQGCTKVGVSAHHHAIIHTASTAPAPIKGEPAMLPSIGVQSRTRGERLDPLSRINFAKIYTVEHNVKVYDFGEIRKESMNTLKRNFKGVFSDLHRSSMTTSDGESDDEPSDNGANAVAPIANLEMHNILVQQYAAYLLDENQRELLSALLTGQYDAQLAIYAQLMSKGVPPTKEVHKFLVLHFVGYLKANGNEREAIGLKLAKAKSDEQLEIYANLIQQGYPLPVRGP